MLIRVSLRGKRRFFIPVPLFVVDILLGAVSDLAVFADLFAPLWRPGLKKRVFPKLGAKSSMHLLSAGVLIRACREFFDELRKYGRWRMVEVETDEVRVYLDFY